MVHFENLENLEMSRISEVVEKEKKNKGMVLQANFYSLFIVTVKNFRLICPCKGIGNKKIYRNSERHKKPYRNLQ